MAFLLAVMQVCLSVWKAQSWRQVCHGTKLFCMEKVTKQMMLDMQEYIHKFESEHVRLHMLLGIDHRGLEVLGIHSYGHREQLIEGVKEYLRAYLRAAETTTQISAKY